MSGKKEGNALFYFVYLYSFSNRKAILLHFFSHCYHLLITYIQLLTFDENMVYCVFMNLSFIRLFNASNFLKYFRVNWTAICVLFINYMGIPIIKVQYFFPTFSKCENYTCEMQI